MSGPDTGQVLYTQDGPVAVLRFSNPPEGYMDEGTEAGLAAALDAIDAAMAAGDGPRAVVLTGDDEGVFIRHYDVRVLEKRARAMAARGMSFHPDRPVPEPRLHACLRRIEAHPLPFVAAINGAAMGGGYELALACDIRIAQAGDYPIGLPEVKLGILPGAGGTQRLAGLVGQARALELILTGTTMPPEQAAALGLVGRCCEGPALEAGLTLARQLAALPPAALAHVKHLLRVAGRDAALHGAALASERTLFCDLMVQPEAIDLMARMNAGNRDIRDP